MKKRGRRTKKRAGKKVKKHVNLGVLIVCLILVFLVAFIGSSFTSKSVNSGWYEKVKPSITPPNFVFPIVWTILFILIALSLYLAWIHGDSNQRVVIAISFGLNFFFNIAWSAFYFGMKNILMGFVDIMFLWLSVILLLKVTYKIDRKSFYLLVPYFLWVSFAAILNRLSLRI
jgi:tryptophan-rich sensory protein